jgi:hypothetical protein
MMKGNDKFLGGLGEGIGHYLPVTGSQLLEDVMQSFQSAELMNGAARGMCESLQLFDMAELIGVIAFARSNEEYGRILGRGCAEKFASFDQEMQSHIINALESDNSFSREFVAALPENLDYISGQSKDRLRELVQKFPHPGDR